MDAPVFVKVPSVEGRGVVLLVSLSKLTTKGLYPSEKAVKGSEAET